MTSGLIPLDELWGAMTGDPQPTVRNVAVGLSRVPRWQGRTLRPWSVLQHSLAAHSLAAEAKPEVQLAVLWHDAAEAVTGDIPSPVKTGEQCALEEDIQAMIYRQALGAPVPMAHVRAAVKLIDERMRDAEAATLLPLKMRQGFPEADPAACQLVLDLLDMTPRQAVEYWELITGSLLEQPTIRALIGRG